MKHQVFILTLTLFFTVRVDSANAQSVEQTYITFEFFASSGNIEKAMIYSEDLKLKLKDEYLESDTLYAFVYKKIASVYHHLHLYTSAEDLIISLTLMFGLWYLLYSAFTETC